MQEAIDILNYFIETEVDIVSAHRTPDKLFDLAAKMPTIQAFSAIIAGLIGAGLPGMVASLPLPVIGVPVVQ